MSARILVVEDDRKTADLVGLYLQHAGHTVAIEHTGDRGLERIAREPFDLLVLDVMLPGVDGLEICRRVRARGGTPIILLTARTREEDRVGGLELGADDYVTKPFSPRELVARVSALLRRTPPGSVELLRRGAIELDRARRVVRVDDRVVAVTASEFALLESLMRHPGHVRSRAQLVELLPGGGYDTLDRTVDAHIRNLRRKIEPDPANPVFLETVVGVGYRFAEQR